jgi:DNA-binding LacI/PurR family transcriptional regulator
MIAGPTTGAGSATYGRAKRLEGYRRALQELGRAIDPSLVVEGNFRYQSGCDAMKALLALDEPPDAVFAANDMMALGAMSIVRENGLRVPDDVALVGFDNVPMTELTTPGLTTIAMPMSELGDAAARLLETNIRLGADHVAVREAFSAELVTRASTVGYAEAIA